MDVSRNAGRRTFAKRARFGVLLICVAILGCRSGGAGKWYWGKACASETQRESDWAACRARSGAAVAAATGNVYLAAAAVSRMQDCMVGLGWRKYKFSAPGPVCHSPVPVPVHLIDPDGQTKGPMPVSGQKPREAEDGARMSFDECFAKCREVTERSKEECFDSCK